MGKPTFSIIVLAFNKRACTERCLESLLASRNPFELVTVDNGSTDGTTALLEDFVPRLAEAGRPMTVIRNEKNRGAVVGRNQAMEVAQGEYCVFLDNDVYAVDPLWLDKLAEPLRTDRVNAIAGPVLVFAGEPDTIQCAGGGISRSGRVQFIGRGERRDDARFARRREVQFVISACMMFRRTLTEEIGRLDEAYSPVQYEDIDFCYRARERGYRVIYEPSVFMLHDESATTAQSPTLRNRYLVIKHGMIFKQRWRHMFEKEDGPPDEETIWKPIGRFKDR